MVQNKGLIFSKVPTELPVAGEHLLIQDRPFDLDQAPPEGGVTTKNYYASFDPYQRGRMRDAAVKSYAPAFTLRQPITNASIVKVIKSANASFKPGEVLITGSETPTEEYSSLGPAQLSGARKLENPHHLDPYLWLGALGMPGLTAFSSLYEIGKPKKGETIFISSAAGAVGQIVGQLAKEEGLKVIGSAGDDKKVDFLSRELQFNGVFNYKKEKPADALKRLAPDGIDIYFENVGGEHLEAALDALNKHGRIGKLAFDKTNATILRVRSMALMAMTDQSLAA